jgi:hypothetical protein
MLGASSSPAIGVLVVNLLLSGVLSQNKLGDVSPFSWMLQKRSFTDVPYGRVSHFLNGKVTMSICRSGKTRKNPDNQTHPSRPAHTEFKG